MEHAKAQFCQWVLSTADHGQKLMTQDGQKLMTQDGQKLMTQDGQKLMTQAGWMCTRELA
jgi:hypothetical protein